jgi:hypothetical protein
LASGEIPPLEATPQPAVNIPGRLSLRSKSLTNIRLLLHNLLVSGNHPSLGCDISTLAWIAVTVMVAAATVAVAVAVAVDRAMVAPLAGQRNMRDYIIVQLEKECDQLSMK